MHRLALALALAGLAACPHHHGVVETPSNQPAEEEAPPAEVPAPTAKLESGTVVLSERIEFATGTDELAPTSEDVLVALRDLLQDRTDVSTLRIEGHSDAQGAEAPNQALTEARAFAIARWLVANGVDCQRLLPVGFGESKPIADNSTAEGRAQNRRIELVVAALRGHPIGGMPVDGGGRVAGDPCR